MTLLHALFFDMDGVIIDTEKDGHRVAFNTAFVEFGINIHWDVKEYGELLKISGGKERMRHYFNIKEVWRDFDDEDPGELIRRLHKRKTEIFVQLIEGGGLKLRPGIHRVMKAANGQGVPVCICTTANPKAAEAVIGNSLSDIEFTHVLAGDVVKKKKPSPEIYLLALERTGAEPSKSIVIEDSRNGMLAGYNAGIRVVVTVSTYTSGEDFSDAALVVNCLGDRDKEQARLLQGEVEGFDGVVTLEMLAAL